VKDAFAGIVASYTGLTGTSKIVLLFLVSVIAIILFNANSIEDNSWRKINPAVFLLSIWSGIAYAAVRAVRFLGYTNISDLDNSKSKKKPGKKSLGFVLATIFAAAMIILSGGFVLTKDCLMNSTLYGLNPLIRIMAVLSIIVYLCLYYMISRRLFKAKSDRAMFMLFVLLLHLFSNYSEKALSFSLFIEPISIASVVIHDVLPLILFLILTFEKELKAFLEGGDEEENKAAGGVLTGQEAGSVVDNEEEIPEEWDMKKHRILNMRNMAIAFVLLFLVFIASIYVLNNKINSLYDATVLLENAANTKMTVDEHRNANGEVDVTVMVSPEGSVTVVGGGETASGTEVYEMISKYSDKVDKWYIYGDEDRGAYDFCKDQGIEVVNAYIVTCAEEAE